MAAVNAIPAEQGIANPGQVVLGGQLVGRDVELVFVADDRVFPTAELDREQQDGQQDDPVDQRNAAQVTQRAGQEQRQQQPGRPGIGAVHLQAVDQQHQAEVGPNHQHCQRAGPPVNGRLECAQQPAQKIQGQRQQETPAVNMPADQPGSKAGERRGRAAPQQCEARLCQGQRPGWRVGGGRIASDRSLVAGGQRMASNGPAPGKKGDQPGQAQRRQEKIGRVSQAVEEAAAPPVVQALPAQRRFEPAIEEYQPRRDERQRQDDGDLLEGGLLGSREREALNPGLFLRDMEGGRLRGFGGGICGWLHGVALGGQAGGRSPTGGRRFEGEVQALTGVHAQAQVR